MEGEKGREVKKGNEGGKLRIEKIREE